MTGVLIAAVHPMNMFMGGWKSEFFRKATFIIGPRQSTKLYSEARDETASPWEWGVRQL